MRPTTRTPKTTASATVASGHGFTLLELLLAVLLLGIVATMIYSVLNVGVRFTGQGEERILTLERRQGCLNLLHTQIRAAAYDKLHKRPDIAAEGDLLRLVTRQPLAPDYPGPVLAFYRYNHEDRTLYYTEKKDYYNMDYQEEYVPDFAAMRPLFRSSPGPMAFSVDELTFTVTLVEEEEQFLFTPKCVAPLPLPE